MRPLIYFKSSSAGAGAGHPRALVRAAVAAASSDNDGRRPGGDAPEKRERPVPNHF